MKKITYFFLWFVIVDSSGLLAKSQYEISLQMIESLRKTAPQGITRKNGLLTTILANMRNLPPRYFYKRGYWERVIETDEGIKHKILYHPASDDKKPYIVFVSGLGNSAYMNAFVRYAFSLVREHGFGAILLENSSSGEWSSRNLRFMMTGYEAGWNIYQVIKKATDLHIIPKGRRVHLIGLSLGGNDALYASYFDSRLKTNLIRSGMAFSSPLDRMASLIDLKIATGVQRALSLRLFSMIYSKADFLFNSHTTKGFRWIFGQGSLKEVTKTVYYPDMLSYFSRYSFHFDELSDDRSLLKIKNLRSLKKFKNYERINRSSHIWDDVNQPFLFIHAKDDPIVSYKTVKGQYEMLAKKPNIGFLGLKMGGHIGFARTYGQKWLEQAIKKYVEYWSHR